jgi:hypothetical protein
MDITIALHSSAVNRGRPASALSITRQMQRLAPAARSHLHLRVLDGIYADGDTVAAAQAAATLAGLDGTRTPADACITGLWSLHRSDTTATRQSIAVMQAALPVSAGGSPAAHCMLLVEAGLLVAANDPRALDRVLALDTINMATPAAGDVATFANLHIARLYQKLGQSESAYAAVRRRPFMTGWPRYLATSLRDESRLALTLGDTAAATRAHDAFTEWRTDSVSATTTGDVNETPVR